MFRFFNKRENTFFGNKAMPKATLIIVTKNSEEEIRNFLTFLKESNPFRQEDSKIIILDYYSFDHTKEVIQSFQDYFENLTFIEKNPSVLLENLIDKYKEESVVQVINLKSIAANHSHLSPKKYIKWYEKLLKISSKETTSIDPIKVVERIEEDRKKVHQNIHYSAIDLLTHTQMLMNQGKENEDVHEYVSNLLEELLEKFNQLDLNFDPDLYVVDSLFANVSGFLEDFTDKTQIDCSVTETGNSHDLQPIIGLSVMRILKEITDIIESIGSATKISVRMDWLNGKVKLRVKDNSTTIDTTFVPLESLSFIEERTELLSGQFSYTMEQDKAVEFKVTIPIQVNGDPDEVE